MNAEYLIEQRAVIRLFELTQQPDLVKGNLDAQHLKAIHSYLFQDSIERKAGQFREPNFNDVHSKKREIYQSPSPKPFFYHNAPSEEAINKILESGKEALKNSKDIQGFSDCMTDIYAQLDYQHPFIEGNSRTLRYFTSLLSQEYAYPLDWNKHQPTNANKDELYRARDLEVVKQNLRINPVLEKGDAREVDSYKLDEVQRHNTKDYIETQIALNKGRYLNAIIKDNLSVNYDKLKEQLTPDQNKAFSEFRDEIIKVFKDHPDQLKAKLNDLDAKLPKIIDGTINLELGKKDLGRDR